MGKVGGKKCRLVCVGLCMPGIRLGFVQEIESCAGCDGGGGGWAG